MRAVQHTPSHQLVRSTPSNVVRSAMMPLPSHLVTSNNPSQQVMRGNMVPSQEMMRRISSHHLAKSDLRPASSSQLPRNVSVKNNRDGTKEVVVETSVSVSYTFQQEDSDGQGGGEHGHKGQDDHKHHLPLEDGTAPGHQLVCCSCMVSMPSMQVGECGCLVCRLCMEMMDRPGYCKNCKMGVRYAGLERIIRFPDKGKLGKLFMAPREREDFSNKEFLRRVLKEEKDFKLVDKILNKQEAAFAKRNTLHTKELEKIVKEEEELQRKILAKTQAISELEESIRSRSKQQYQHVTMPMLQYQPILQIQQEANQQMVTQDEIHQGGARHDDEQEKLEVLDMNYDENDSTEFQHKMHDRGLLKDRMKVMEGEFEEKTVYKVGPEHITHQVKERKGEESTKEASFSDWIPARKKITCKVGSSLGVEVSPAVGLKSILKKKIASRLFVQEDGQATTSLLGGEVKKKEKSGEVDEKIRRDKKRGRMEETQGRSITLVPEDLRKMEDERGRVEEAHGRNITQVCGNWRMMDIPSKKRGKMEETQDPDSGCVTERTLVDNLKKSEVGVEKVIVSSVECQVPNNKLENDEPMSMKKLHRSSRMNVMNEQKHGPVSASQWINRAVKGGAGGADTSSIRDRPSQGHKESQDASRARKALPQLSSVRHPDRRNREAGQAVTEKASSSSEKKDKNNMTYDYLDMIVNRGGVVGGKRAGAELRPSASGINGVQGLAKTGGLAGRNSQLSWDQYLL